MIKSIGGSANRPTEASVDSPEKKLREVAGLYEKHFLGTMLKAMRSTVQESGFIKSNQAEKIFKEQLDQEYVTKWGEKGGIGLQDLIYNQLVERYGAQLGIKSPIDKPKGPLPLDSHSEFTGRSVGQKRENLEYRFEKSSGFGSPQSLVSPWKGQILNQIALDGDEQLLEVEHDNGLLSQFVYRGPKSYLRENDRIEPGQSLAVLSPEAKGFFWNLKSRL